MLDNKRTSRPPCAPANGLKMAGLVFLSVFWVLAGALAKGTAWAGFDCAILLQLTNALASQFFFNHAAPAYVPTLAFSSFWPFARAPRRPRSNGSHAFLAHLAPHAKNTELVRASCRPFITLSIRPSHSQRPPVVYFSCPPARRCCVCAHTRARARASR